MHDDRTKSIDVTYNFICEIVLSHYCIKKVATTNNISSKYDNEVIFFEQVRALIGFIECDSP